MTLAAAPGGIARDAGAIDASADHQKVAPVGHAIPRAPGALDLRLTPFAFRRKGRRWHYGGKGQRLQPHHRMRKRACPPPDSVPSSSPSTRAQRRRGPSFSCTDLCRPGRRAAGIAPSIFPASGWVEHDAEEIWSATVAGHDARGARQGRAATAARRWPPSASPTSARPPSCGTATTGKADPPRHRLAGPPHRRHAARAEAWPVTKPWSQAKHRPRFIDPYFSGTKLAWILDNVPGARERQRSRANSPPVPSIAFLLWRLTGGKVHATDATNASRSHAVRHPYAANGTPSFAEAPRRADARCLPEVDGLRRRARRRHDRPIAVRRGHCRSRGMAGDQQAATVGQACFAAGHGEVDLRHRLLRAAQHGRGAP